MDDIVYKYNGHWYWSEIPNDDKNAEEKRALKSIYAQPVTDSSTIDTFIIGDGNKYGIFTFVSALGMGMDARFITIDDEPFPFDEILINHGSDCLHSVLAVRIGNKWGLILLRKAYKYDSTFGCINRLSLTSIEYESKEEAVDAFIGSNWRYVSDR